MTRTITIGALLLSLSGFATGIVDARRQASKSPRASEEQERMLANGKRISSSGARRATMMAAGRR